MHHYRQSRLSVAQATRYLSQIRSGQIGLDMAKTCLTAVCQDYPLMGRLQNEAAKFLHRISAKLNESELKWTMLNTSDLSVNRWVLSQVHRLSLLLDILTDFGPQPMSLGQLTLVRTWLTHYQGVAMPSDINQLIQWLLDQQRTSWLVDMQWISSSSLVRWLDTNTTPDSIGDQHRIYQVLAKRGVVDLVYQGDQAQVFFRQRVLTHDTKLQQSLDILGFKKLPKTIQDLKNRYHMLIKRYHPDVADAPAVAEPTPPIQGIVDAYQYLKHRMGTSKILN